MIRYNIHYSIIYSVLGNDLARDDEPQKRFFLQLGLHISTHGTPFKEIGSETFLKLLRCLDDRVQPLDERKVSRMMADIHACTKSCVMQKMTAELSRDVESVTVVTDARSSAICHYASSRPPKTDRLTLETKVLEGTRSVTELATWLKDQLNKLIGEIPSTGNLPLYVVTAPGKAAAAASTLLKKDANTDGMIDGSVICVNAVLLECLESALGHEWAGQTLPLVDWRIKFSSFFEKVKSLSTESMSEERNNPSFGLKVFGLEWRNFYKLLELSINDHREILQNAQVQQSDGCHRMTPSENDVRSMEKLHKFFGLVKTVTEKLSDPNKATIHRVITELHWLEGQIETDLPRTSDFSSAPFPPSFPRKQGSTYLYAKEFVKELEQHVGTCGTKVLLFKAANFLDPFYKDTYLREVAKKCHLSEFHFVDQVEKFLQTILALDPPARVDAEPCQPGYLSPALPDEATLLREDIKLYKLLTCSKEFHFDPLPWWAKNRKRLPHLSKAAFRILSVPPVAASLESNPDRPTVADIRENLPAVEEEVLGSIRFSFDDAPAADELNVDEDQ